MTEEQKLELHKLHVEGVQVTTGVIAEGMASEEEERQAAVDYIQHFQEKFGEQHE